ncbi:hypothetical protein GGI04_004474 [Coemansia thaxteri]|uniref:5-formyltetrahydrofolate cyclo-ligase n=1 Tax=Coemansia thaxteri TaxID=2663907 RepID=A0A9W8BIB3_9FUNG|nr:hypothetical protein GGI04_004474 [Coemansia thaxteri]KAJ2004113.1 hypothetical protein H4R26_002701 [Coemansia thaxteri]KAJ2468805.1 hypothetical protein GGI02_003591 [Coemansia sp. RSA 2322]KAJ2483340.1 hypothetical protein EV174_002967 [Coemansia sp. RSA 2320]
MSLLSNAKQQLRKVLRPQLLQIPASELQAESRLIHKHVLAHSTFQQAQHVSIYLSMGAGEVQTYELVDAALAAGKHVYVPRCRGSVMDMVRVPDRAAVASLSRNAWGIPEPGAEEPAADPRLLDFVVVPGLAFDITGNRCGHGRGYYDRYLSQLSSSATTCALCLSKQLLNSVPVGDLDIKPRLLVTPKGIVYQNSEN